LAVTGEGEVLPALTPAGCVPRRRRAPEPAAWCLRQVGLAEPLPRVLGSLLASSRHRAAECRPTSLFTCQEWIGASGCRCWWCLAWVHLVFWDGYGVASWTLLLHKCWVYASSPVGVVGVGP